MITVLLFILVLSVLVFVHELGHFVVAKLAGMRVDEFGIGFPPRVISWGKGETKYSINLLPFGGFVRIHGENPNDESLKGVDSTRSFTARPRYWQVAVLIAGVSCNIIFAWFLTTAGFIYGLPVSADNSPAPLERVSVMITNVQDNSPAKNAGLKEGDELELLETSSDALTPLTAKEVIAFITTHGVEPITLHYKRANIAQSVRITPVRGMITGSPDQPALGVSLDAVGILKLPVHRALIEGGKATYYSVINTATGLFDFIGKVFTEKGAFKNVSGPVGIAKLVGDARTLGLPYFISFVSFISINLAVINLLPLPALDGGRILLVLIESVIRRPISYKFTNAINATGFLLLLALMAFVTYHDIVKLIMK